MKKLLISFTLIAALSFIPAEAPKTLKIEGDLQAFQALLDCLEESNAPHAKVEAVKKWFVPQLNKQLADTSKKK